jgi:hypothetical protein
MREDAGVLGFYWEPREKGERASWLISVLYT